MEDEVDTHALYAMIKNDVVGAEESDNDTDYSSDKRESFDNTDEEMPPLSTDSDNDYEENSSMLKIMQGLMGKEGKQKGKEREPPTEEEKKQMEENKRREEALFKLNMLLEDDNQEMDQLHVHISDRRSLLTEHEEMLDKIHMIRNKNIGDLSEQEIAIVLPELERENRFYSRATVDLPNTFLGSLDQSQKLELKKLVFDEINNYLLHPVSNNLSSSSTMTKFEEVAKIKQKKYCELSDSEKLLLFEELKKEVECIKLQPPKPIITALPINNRSWKQLTVDEKINWYHEMEASSIYSQSQSEKEVNFLASVNHRTINTLNGHEKHQLMKTLKK